MADLDNIDQFIEILCARPGMFVGSPPSFFSISCMIDGFAMGRGRQAQSSLKAFNKWLAGECYNRFKYARNYGWQSYLQLMFADDQEQLLALPNLWRLFRQGGTLRGVRLQSLTKQNHRPNLLRPGVFLDLQGTLGGDGLGDIRGFAFYPFAVSALRLLKEAGLRAVVVTNQSRIAKGVFTYEQYLERVWELERQLGRVDAEWDAIYCCPHQSSDHCACQKPKTKLIADAVRSFGIDLPKSYVVGDMGASDIAMGHSLGCKTILVRTGVGESSLTDYRHTWANIEPDYIAADVLEAARWIIDDCGGKPG